MALALSIVIPAYNEAARIGKTLRTVLDYLEEQPGACELIVVDDGSGDGTRQVAEEIFASRAGGGVEARVQIGRAHV